MLVPTSGMEGVETPTTQPTNLTGGAGTIYVQKVGKTVQLLLNGQFNNIGTSNVTICQLPNGFKPNKLLYYESVSYSSTPSGKSYKYIVAIGTNGDVLCKIYNSDSTSPTATNVFLGNTFMFFTNE